MLRKFQKASKIVHETISLGSVNVPNSSETYKDILAKQELVSFYRALLNQICLMQEASDRSKLNLEKAFLFSVILRAILAEIYKTGNCGDYTAVGLLILLKMGIQKKIDWIHLVDATDDHSFIIYNRDVKIEIKNFEKFGNVIFFDNWPGSKKVKEFSGQSSDIFSLAEFKDTLGEIKKIDLSLRIENDFTYIEWLELSLLLVKKISLITETVVQQMLGKNYLSLDAKVETRKIREKFARESQVFGMLSEKIRPLSGSSLFSDSLKISICKELFRITSEEWKYSEKAKAATFCSNNIILIRQLETYLASYYIFTKLEHNVNLHIHILKLTIPNLNDLQKIPVLPIPKSPECTIS